MFRLLLRSDLFSSMRYCLNFSFSINSKSSSVKLLDVSSTSKIISAFSIEDIERSTPIFSTIS